MKQIIFTIFLALAFSFSAFAQNTSSLCAKIEVTGGGVVQPGEPMNFTANVTGTTENSTLEYEWTVSLGTISSGQGTSSITVDTTELRGVNITATVKIKGFNSNCVDEASEIGSVATPPICRCIFDEFGKLPNDEVKARIQNMYVELGNNPNAQGYILNYGTETEITNREKQTKKAINYLKLDSRRVTDVRCGANLYSDKAVWTKIFIIPPGLNAPQC